LTLIFLALGVFYGSVVQRAKADAAAAYATRDSSHILILQLDRQNAPGLWSVPLMPPLVDAYNVLQKYILNHGVGTVWQEHQVFWRDEVRKWGAYEAVRGKALLPEDAVTARGSIGIFGYYLAELEVIDLKGLTDREVARQPTDRPNERRYMAHDRFASLEYLHSRGFNLIVEPAEHSRGDALLAAPFALRIADDLWMPFTSRLPEWVETAFTGRPLWLWRNAREIGCFQPESVHGWTFQGEAFGTGPTSALLMTRTILWPKRCALDQGLSSRDGGAQRTGLVRSPPFEARANTVVELRLGGTPIDQVGVRLVDAEGSVLAAMKPVDETSLFPEHFDLTPFAGRQVAVEVFDESAEGWVIASGIVVLEARPLTDG
jgi:hypothetical protein